MSINSITVYLITFCEIEIQIYFHIFYHKVIVVDDNFSYFEVYICIYVCVPFLT